MTRRSFLYHPSGESRIFVDDDIERHLSDGWYNSPDEAEQSKGVITVATENTQDKTPAELYAEKFGKKPDGRWSEERILEALNADRI